MSVASLYNLIGGRDEIVRALGMYFLEELDEAFVQLQAHTPGASPRTAHRGDRRRQQGVAQIRAPGVLSDAQLYTKLVPSWRPSGTG